jgi:hypothetical protein
MVKFQYETLQSQCDFWDDSHSRHDNLRVLETVPDDCPEGTPDTGLRSIVEAARGAGCALRGAVHRVVDGLAINLLSRGRCV